MKSSRQIFISLMVIAVLSVLVSANHDNHDNDRHHNHHNDGGRGDNNHHNNHDNNHNNHNDHDNNIDRQSGQGWSDNDQNNDNGQVYYCQRTDRNHDYCSDIWQPVCGYYSQNQHQGDHSYRDTYSNPCEACQDWKVERYICGQC